MAKTTLNLVTRVLQKLVALQPGEDPNAEDTEFLTDVWQTVNANLRRLKISFWPDNSIPDEAFEPVAEYLKEYVWQEYRGTRDGNAAIVRNALSSVRAATSPRYMGNAVKAEYF